MSNPAAYDHHVAIIGAGPYGLSLSAHLRHARIPFAFFGSAMESWRRFMPRGMTLKSEPFASNLWDPGRRYTLRRYFGERGWKYRPIGSPLSIELFLDYAEWFRIQTSGAPADLKVVELQRLPAGFSLRLGDGNSLTARNVVLATGHMPFRRMPAHLMQIPEPLVSHSSRIGDTKQYAHRDVTIVGAGQSALETAALLSEAGATVRILTRRSQIEWNAPSKPRTLHARIRAPDAAVATGWGALAVAEMPQLFRRLFPPVKRHRFVAAAYGPSGAWWLRNRVDGVVPIWIRSEVQNVSKVDGHLELSVHRLDTAETIATDHLITATGFSVDVDKMTFLEQSLRDSILRESQGLPALDRHFETSVPGLFIVGVASSPIFGPIMRFMYGAKHVGPVLARRLKTRK